MQAASRRRAAGSGSPCARIFWAAAGSRRRSIARSCPSCRKWSSSRSARSIRAGRRRRCFSFFRTVICAGSGTGSRERGVLWGSRGLCGSPLIVRFVRLLPVVPDRMGCVGCVGCELVLVSPVVLGRALRALRALCSLADGGAGRAGRRSCPSYRSRPPLPVVPPQRRAAAPNG
ncbi:hypothetical protein BURKHO8Y_170460 [Burkholderia sp. 8Y]|nr:hypothetical protein BURKHO8Y_170460 [Burkholderia sp. 8Y]